MENFAGLIMGILYGFFVANQWAKRKLRKLHYLNNIEVFDAEVVEVEDDAPMLFICDFGSVENDYSVVITRINTAGNGRY